MKEFYVNKEMVIVLRIFYSLNPKIESNLLLLFYKNISHILLFFMDLNVPSSSARTIDGKTSFGNNFLNRRQQ